MKPVKIAGHKVPCSVCHRYPTVEVFHEMAVCRYCLRPLLIGFMAGSMYSEESASIAESLKNGKSAEEE